MTLLRCVPALIVGLVLAPLACASPEGPVPEHRPASLVAICDSTEPGDRLEFWGRVLDYDGRPLSEAAVIAYHTDRAGLYNPPDSPTSVPRLRAVCITDEDGRFGFSTIRPAAYPNRNEPAHIHMSVTAPRHRVSYVDIWFEGDPLITSSHRDRARSGSTVIVEPVRGSDGVSAFVHDIRLEGN